MDATLAQPSTNPSPSLGLTLGEYAERTGQSVWTVRAKIRRGEVPAQLVKGRHGVEYRIDPDASMVPSLDNPSAQPSTTVGPRVAQPDISLGEIATLLRDKDQQLDRLHRENLELAGRVGFLQAQLIERDKQIALLSAPTPTDHPLAETDNHLAPSSNGPDSPVQRLSEQAKRPWWRRIGSWLVQPV